MTSKINMFVYYCWFFLFLLNILIDLSRMFGAPFSQVAGTFLDFLKHLTGWSIDFSSSALPTAGQSVTEQSGIKESLTLLGFVLVQAAALIAAAHGTIEVQHLITPPGALDAPDTLRQTRKSQAERTRALVTYSLATVLTLGAFVGILRSKVKLPDGHEYHYYDRATCVFSSWMLLGCLTFCIYLGVSERFGVLWGQEKSQDIRVKSIKFDYYKFKSQAEGMVCTLRFQATRIPDGVETVVFTANLDEILQKRWYIANAQGYEISPSDPRNPEGPEARKKSSQILFNDTDVVERRKSTVTFLIDPRGDWFEIDFLLHQRTSNLSEAQIKDLVAGLNKAGQEHLAFGFLDGSKEDKNSK